MNEINVPASEIRERFAEYMDRIDRDGRVVITKNGKEKAYLISVRELRALEETIAVLESSALVQNVREGLADIQAGRMRDAEDVFTDIDRESGE